jgi:hypothetical protein
MITITLSEEEVDLVIEGLSGIYHSRTQFEPVDHAEQRRNERDIDLAQKLRNRLKGAP